MIISILAAIANLHAANDSVLNQGDPYHLNYDNCSSVGYWAWRRTAYEIKRISDLFKTVFGEENVGSWKRVRSILAGQVVYTAVIVHGLNYINDVFGSPSKFFHGIAVAPYFSLHGITCRSTFQTSTKTKKQSIK